MEKQHELVPRLETGSIHDQTTRYVLVADRWTPWIKVYRNDALILAVEARTCPCCGAYDLGDGTYLVRKSYS